MTDTPWHDDEDDDPAIICDVTGTYCVRAFCEDYGCANKAGVPVDGYDVECGSIDLDETAPAIPKALKKPKQRKARR